MVWWDQTNVSPLIQEQGPASQKISLPLTVCLSLTIQGNAFLLDYFKTGISFLFFFQRNQTLMISWPLFLCCSGYRKFNQMPREAVGPWPSPAHGPGPTPPGSLPEGETEAMSNAQRSTLKWEKEETLGELATVAPVLYTNVNFPNLKEEYPGWYMALKL